jgi:hypothetical protein
MLRRAAMLGLTAVMFLLAACSPGKTASETPEVVKISDPCLVGIWELTTPEPYLRASIPVGAVDPTALNFVASNGELAYKLDEDGTLLIQALDLQGRFGLSTEDQGRLGLEVYITGYARARFSQQGDVMKGEWIDNYETIAFAAYLDKELMMESKFGAEFLPLFVQPYNSARYTCTQENLSLELLNLPSANGPIVFKRVE